MGDGSNEPNDWRRHLSRAEEGASDLLIVKGNPLKEISILTKPEENLALIMKDGNIHKNAIQ